MKKGIKTGAVWAVFAGLCMGCGKSDKAGTADLPAVEPAELAAPGATPAGSAEIKDWEPETVAPPQASTEHGHDHGDGSDHGHSH